MQRLEYLKCFVVLRNLSEVRVCVIKFGSDSGRQLCNKRKGQRKIIFVKISILAYINNKFLREFRGQ